VLISRLHLEIYLQKPTAYLLKNRQFLMPDWDWDWQRQTPTLILILLQAQFSLLEDSELIQQEKDRLLGKFMRLGQKIKLENDRQNHLTEIIFPVDGKPLFSKTGDSVFNLPVLIQDALGFPVEKTTQGCQVCIHPFWSDGVYPGLLLTNISIEKTLAIVDVITFSTST